MTPRIALPILLSLALFPACKNRDQGNSPAANNLTVAKPMEATPAAPSTPAPSSPQMAAKTPQATTPMATARTSQARSPKPMARPMRPMARRAKTEAKPVKLEKEAANKPVVKAKAKSWDIGESMKPLSPSEKVKAKAMGPKMATKVRALAATIPNAPAEHSRTAFITIHPAIRLSGDTELAMPRALTDAMEAAGEQEVYYRGRVCMNAKGKPLFVQAIESTDVPAADHEIEKAVMGWRYAPFAPNDKAMPFCTGVKFAFKLPYAGDPNPTE